MLKAIAAEALMSAFSILLILLPVPFASKVLLVKVSVVLAVTVPKAVPLIEELDPKSKALKEDIYQIENALDKVKKLRGVHFTKKADKSKEIGVVANEVEKVVPELVDEHEDKKLGSIKIMKYANTVGLLIEAVKDLSKQVEELKNGSSN